MAGLTFRDQLFADNLASTLAEALSADGTCLVLAAGDGARCPAPSGNTFFEMTLIERTSGVEHAWEVVTVTARSGDVLTIERGGGARAWPAGTPAQLRWNAATVNRIRTAIAARGDVFGPAAASNGHLAVFDGPTGTLLRSGGDFNTAVRAAVLTGFSLGTDSTITAGHSILQAFGQVQAQINAARSVAAAAIPATQKGVANGIAPLGADSKIASIYLPSSTTDDVPEGASRLYLTAQRVRDVTLGSYSLVSSAISPTDTLVLALGKLQAQVSARAASASPALTGTPTAPTPADGTNTTQIANTAHVYAATKALGLGGDGRNMGTAAMSTAPLGSVCRFEGTATQAAAAGDWPHIIGANNPNQAWIVSTTGTDGGNARIQQTAVFAFSFGAGRAFTRTKHDATWSAWTESATTAYVDTAVAAARVPPEKRVVNIATSTTITSDNDDVEYLFISSNITVSLRPYAGSDYPARGTRVRFLNPWGFSRIKISAAERVQTQYDDLEVDSTLPFCLTFINETSGWLISNSF